jgi:competence protein ComEC
MSNVLVTPLIEFVVVVGMASEGVTALLPFLGQFGLSFCQGLMIVINKIALVSQSVPGATWNLPHVPIGIAMCILTASVVWLIPETIPHPKLRISVILGTSVLSVTFLITTALLPSPLHLIFIDVGQGDSTLILTPGGHSILIDAGVPEAGKNPVIPVLKYYGITQLDLIIVTHFDRDHVGGIPIVTNTIPAKRVITNGHDVAYPDYHLSPRDRLSEAPLHQLLRIEQGLTLRLFNLKSSLFSKENDHSVITKLEYGTFSCLITGDLEAIGETAIANDYAPYLRAQILKLGHHGSKTSTCELFLATVSPQIAIVSAGRHNRYGHPHPTVMSRLTRHRIPVYRTDQQGAITVQSDGRAFNIRTWYEK